MKDLYSTVIFHYFLSYSDDLIKSYTSTFPARCFWVIFQCYFRVSLDFSTSCSRCLFFSVFDVFSMVCLVCPCQTLRFVACLCSTYLTMMFSDLSFFVCSLSDFCDFLHHPDDIVFGHFEQCLSASAEGISLPTFSWVALCCFTDWRRCHPSVTGFLLCLFPINLVLTCKKKKKKYQR